MSNQSQWGKWGNVPVDQDVRPFSRIDIHRGNERRNNKRHHFLSVTYMDGFRDSIDRVWAYRSEEPAKPLHVPPASIGFEKFYYSQKLPDGTQENHKFEDLWNAIETVWPETIQAVAARRLSPAISFNLLGMATILKTRVPAARDRNEILIAAKLRAEVTTLDKLGRLPPELQRYAGETSSVPIGINPQQTLLAMNSEFKDFGDLCFQMGFEIIHNTSDHAFITSDNPVCIYDPATPTHLRRPYEYDGAIELIFPLSSKMLLRGSNRLRPSNQVSRHSELCDPIQVQLLNQTAAQFSYRLLIASDRSADNLALQYADSVPTVELDMQRTDTEIQIIWRHVFGPRPALSQYVDTPEKAARLEKIMEQRQASTESDPEC